MSTRPAPLFAANWKMHKAPSEAAAFVREFAARWGPRRDREVLFFPPSISVPAFRRATAAAERPDLQVGVQDVHQETAGAHTGAISASMAADAGAAWSLVGHSERRREFGDDDEVVAAKLRRVLEAGLRPLVCVGETLEEREAGRLPEILSRQARGALGSLSEEERSRVATWAYEPVWAIGTGRTAAPADAEEAHAILREELTRFSGLPGRARILYGGSVKPDNIEGLLAVEGVDGVLVGGASLEPAPFAAICDATIGPD